MSTRRWKGLKIGVSEGYEKFKAYSREKDAAIAKDLAIAMHAYVCGDWGAAGWEVQQGFLAAGEAARDALTERGWDLFAYPKGGWGLVT